MLLRSDFRVKRETFLVLAPALPIGGVHWPEPVSVASAGL